GTRARRGGEPGAKHCRVSAALRAERPAVGMGGNRPLSRGGARQRVHARQGDPRYRREPGRRPALRRGRRASRPLLTLAVALAEELAAGRPCGASTLKKRTSAVTLPLFHRSRFYSLAPARVLLRSVPSEKTIPISYPCRVPGPIP